MRRWLVPVVIAWVASVIAGFDLFVSNQGEARPGEVALPIPLTVFRDGNYYTARVLLTPGVAISPAHPDELLAYDFDAYDPAARPECNSFGTVTSVVSESATTVTVATVGYRSYRKGEFTCGFTSLSSGEPSAQVLHLRSDLGRRRIVDAHTDTGIAVFAKGTTPPEPGYLPVGFHQTDVEAVGDSSVDGTDSSRTFRDAGGADVEVRLSSATPYPHDGTVVGRASVRGRAATLTHEDFENCVSWTEPGSRELEVCSFVGQGADVPDSVLVTIARSLR